MPSKLGSLLAIGTMSVFLGVAVLSAPAVASENATVSDEANVRSRPNTDSAILAVLPVGTPVEVDCWADGELTYGTTRWFHLSEGGWIHSTLVTQVDVSPCSGATTGSADTAYTGKIGVGAGIGSGGGGNSGGGGAYDSCDEAPGPVYRGSPGYGPHLDRDGDGVGCEGN